MIDDTEHTALLRAVHDQQRQQGSSEALQWRAATKGKIANWLAVPALAQILLLVQWSGFAELAWS